MANEKKPLREGYQPKDPRTGKYGYQPQQPAQQVRPTPPITTQPITPPKSDKKP